MMYNQSVLKKLGKIVANHEKRPLGELIEIYEANFLNIFSKPATPAKAINAMMHALGYFSKGLDTKEKQFFLKLLEDYKAKKIPLSVPLVILKEFVERFDEKYLRKQTFFEPYPEQLMEITDSGKGRDVK